MTSICKLIVGGFKSIRERTEIPIAPLTFLFGPNSAGKSAVLGAVNSLLERINEESTKRKDYYGDTAPPAIARGSAYLGKERKPYADDETDDQLLENYPHVTLGVEIEDFSALENEPIERLDIKRNSIGQPTLSARSLYWAMDGSSVQVEIAEYYLDERWRVTSSQLVIDQIHFLGFFSAGDLGAVKFPTVSGLQDWTANTNIKLSNLYGSVAVNLGHPIFSLHSIVDGPANFESRLDRELASDFDYQRIELRKILQKLKKILLSDEQTFLHHMMVVDGDWLYFRASAGFINVDPWMPENFYQSIYPSFSDMWKKAGFGPDEEQKNLSLIQNVNMFFDVLHHFGALVLASAADTLKVTAVEGDRQILKPDDVTVQMPTLHVKHLLANKYWTPSWGWGPWRFSFQKTSDKNPYLSLYAFWLGNEKFEKTLDILSQIQLMDVRREDFVNCVMNMGIFGLRRYEVKPEVWSIKTKPLVFRNPIEEGGEESDFEEEDLKVQLYLEDQNGRRLDFHEVGSGISYVMPILASLNAAKTSWIAQPELHLHPAAQCEMGDVFLRAFNRGHFSVVETHSEHLLLRVLKRIRQTTRGAEMDEDLKCAPEAVSVLYFDPQEDGSTDIKQMRVSRLGDFKDRWPHGFFEERSRELFDE